MATYITIFLFEFISAYIVWIIFRKVFKVTNLCGVVIACFVFSLAIGYIASYRIVGYEVTMGYLTEINNQRIEQTGESITLEEENAYKEELFQRKDFKETLRNSSIKISLIPFILVVFIMLFFVKKTARILLPSSAELSNPPKAN